MYKLSGHVLTYYVHSMSRQQTQQLEGGRKAAPCCCAAPAVVHDMMMPQFDQTIGPSLALRLGAAHAACREEAPRVDIPRLFCIACACVQPVLALRWMLAALEWLYKLDAIKS